MNKFNEVKTIIKPSEEVIVDFVFETMLKKFTKQVDASGILQEVKERRYYTKPSETRHKLLGTIKRKQKLWRRKQRRK